MKRLLLIPGVLGLALWAWPAAAQTPCISVAGVTSVPQPGVTCASEPIVPSYAATSVALVPVAAGATDFFCIDGVANKVIRIQSIRVSGTASTEVNVPVLVMKHVSLNTGSASATTTQIPIPYALDSSYAAAAAVTKAWITANPTITDAAPGIIEAQNVTLGTTGTIANPSFALFDWRERNYMSAPVLRSAVQEICLNLNTTAVTGGLLYTNIQWTESPQ